MRENLKKYIKIILIVVLILSAIFFLKDFITIQKIENLLEKSGIFAPIIFGLIYVLVTTFGISAGIFTIIAGTFFGKLNGLIIVVISATISAGIAFFIARYFSKNLNLEKNKLTKTLIKKVDEKAKENGFIAVCILRLLFLPYIPLSYACGVIKKLKFKDFILATFITNIFGSFLFIFLGDEIKNLFTQGFNIVSFTKLISIFILLILFIYFVPKITKKIEDKLNKK